MASVQNYIQYTKKIGNTIIYDIIHSIVLNNNDIS